jgi:DUF3047 family protein
MTGFRQVNRHITRFYGGIMRHLFQISVLILTFLLVTFSGLSAEEMVPVGLFSKGELEGWQNKSFEGETDYHLVTMGGLKVIKAVSSQTSSGFYKEVEIDLVKTPYLNWSWMTESLLLGNDEKKKSGDDYVARIYVVAKTGPFFFNLKALNYVWSSHNPEGSDWANAFTSKAWIVTIRSGGEKTGQWIHEKRDVRKDFSKYFDMDIDSINAVAIMTDTDNSGQQATAFYGDIYFSAD